jgi:hypothetical protein
MMNIDDVLFAGIYMLVDIPCPTIRRRNRVFSILLY